MDIYDIPEWQEFENKIIGIVDRQDEVKVPFKPYAQTYARNIVAGVYKSMAMGINTIDVIKTQILYVLNNMGGAPEEEMRIMQKFISEKGIDVSEIINKMLNGEEE